MIVVSDSSPLIALAAAGELNLLRELFGEVLIPVGVWDEIVQADRTGAEQLRKAPWVRVEPAPDDSFLFVLRREVDPGEAEAIALAFSARADLLLLDERRARNLATSLGFMVVGVIGVLLQAKQQGFLPLIRPVVERMRSEVQFRISDALFDVTLRAAGEIE